jgi:hypothetical protein
MADLIERGAGSATVPRLPWMLITPLLRVLPASWLTRAAPQRDAATGPGDRPLYGARFGRSAISARHPTTGGCDRLRA